MKALLYKQVRLVAHPMTFVFLLAGAMLLIPNYPYSAAFFYVTLGLFFMFVNARDQRDAAYSALLPIRKRDSVRSAAAFCIGIELASIALAVPFAVLSAQINPSGGNAAGVDANAAALALGFLVFAVFNGVFLPAFYRTGYKAGVSFGKACAATAVVLAIDVIGPHVLPWLDGQDVRQFAVLAAAAVVFAVVTWLSCRRAEDLYERVDL